MPRAQYRCFHHSIQAKAPRWPKAITLCSSRAGRPSTSLPKLISRISSSVASKSQAPKRRWRQPLGFLLVTVSVVGGAWTYRSWRNIQYLNPKTFQFFVRESTEDVSPNSFILTLNGNCWSNQRIYEDAWRKGIWSVQVKHPFMNIARSYTPLPPSEAFFNNTSRSSFEDEKWSGALRFFIRREPKGEVSNYLYALLKDAWAELRGPYLEFEIPHDVEEILFIAGGTGIAPALQTAHTLLNYRSETRKPRLHILWANRSSQDCASPRPLKNLGTENEPNRLFSDLKALAENKSDQVRVEYFVDEEKKYVTEKVLKNYLNPRRIDPNRPLSVGRKLVMISGPDGFVDYIAGPKEWKEGRHTQGGLGGILKKTQAHGWDVWKL